jgi:type II secretory pathway pseudopilin PulG
VTKYLGITIGVLAALLALSGWLLRQAWAENGALEAKLADAQAVIQQREQDAKLNAIAVAQLADKLNRTETKVITQVEKIYAAPVTRECAQSPAMRAASDGVRDLIAPAVQAPDRRGAPAAVPGSGAGAGERQRQ